MMELPSASVLRISDEKTMQLLNLYSKEDCLWNTKVEDYKNKEKRQLAADKIATILDLPNFTAKHVMMKFKNLRNSYSQEQKKIANSIKSGATGDDVYTPRVFWYSKMDSFIRPHVQGKPQKEVPMTYKLDELTEEWMPVNNAEYLFPPDTSLAEASASDDDRPNDSARKKRRVHAPVNTIEIQEQKSVLQSLKDIQSHLHVLMSHNDDYYDTFGKYVASLLRTLPPQQALTLQPKIVSLITNGMDGFDSEGQLVTSESQSSHDVLSNMKIDRDDSD